MTIGSIGQAGRPAPAQAGDADPIKALCNAGVARAKKLDSDGSGTITSTEASALVDKVAALTAKLQKGFKALCPEGRPELDMSRVPVARKTLTDAERYDLALGQALENAGDQALPMDELGKRLEKHWAMCLDALKESPDDPGLAAGRLFAILSLPDAAYLSIRSSLTGSR